MTATPLPEPIERCDNLSDFDTTRRFRAIMEHADNAEVARMYTVGLPTNDPPRIETPADEPDHIAQARRHGSLSYTDRDGDAISLLYFEGECATHGTEAGVGIGINGAVAVAIPREHLGPIIAFLTARYAGLPIDEEG